MEEILEEEQQIQGEGETPVETPEEGQEETPEKEPQEKPEEDVEELKRKNRQLYARLKKVEEQLKKYKAQTKASEEVGIDPVQLVKTVSVLKDYSPEEVDFISKIAKAEGVSLEEAVKMPEVQLYIQARREKVAKEQKVPEPSSPSSTTKEITPEEIAKMSDEEFRKFEEEMKKKMAGGSGI